MFCHTDAATVLGRWRLEVVTLSWRIERPGRVPPASAQLVEAEISRDGVEPGRKARRHAVAPGRLPDLHKDLLGQVFGFVRVADVAQDEVEDRLFVLLNQRLERAQIPLLYAEHQRGVF